MTRKFSQAAYDWVANYHGSIDTTALLLAFDAGYWSPENDDGDA